MKIWVYLNGIQQGPYTMEEFEHLGVSPSTPVWYEGLPQWQPASEAPATAALFADAHVAEQVHTAEATAADTFEPQPLRAQSMQKADLPAQPPTFIGWSIFILLCCFPIGGLLGIIFSVMSGNAYRSGDYTKAARMSEWSEWCVIISIVIGLLSMPLALILL